MKSVFVREALDFYKSQYEKQQFSNIENTEISHFDINEALEKLQTDELRNQINKLPDKARLVFNLYVIDGYNHAEIAQLLQINEGTSKSQLFEAKKRLKYQIKQLNEFVLQTK
jgi:RNA polymerase sigma-70 factor (ECF subfamily)